MRQRSADFFSSSCFSRVNSMSVKLHYREKPFWSIVWNWIEPFSLEIIQSNENIIRRYLHTYVSKFGMCKRVTEMNRINQKFVREKNLSKRHVLLKQSPKWGRWPFWFRKTEVHLMNLMNQQQQQQSSENFTSCKHSGTLHTGHMWASELLNDHSYAQKV